MLTKTQIDRIIPVLEEAVYRPLEMKVRRFPRPYYSSFLLRDVYWFNTWASSGSTFRKREDRSRDVYCDIRVGSYRHDQTSDGGLFDNDEESESFQHIRIPIDDKCLNGLKLVLWRLTEAKFREALSDYNNKETQRLSHIDENRKYSSFTKLEALRDVQYQASEKIDDAGWTTFCKNASRWLSTLKEVDQNYVEFDASQESRVFVNTEGRTIVQHTQIFTVIANIRKLTGEGVFVEQDLVWNSASQKETLSMAEFKKKMKQKHKQLLQLMKARKIHSFSGPVLLNPVPAGLLFHEAIGHRLEGSRLLSSGEGQTFKGQSGKKVLNVNLSIVDNPRLQRFKGRSCTGAYRYDDEGTPAAAATLIEGGILKGFLNSRAELPLKKNEMNGHARCRQHQRPISRMGVTIVEGREAVSFKKLKGMLLEEIKKQGKPFGMIVYETAGGETDTTTYDFQAFSGVISYATLVFPDGREEVVRGVDFVGTPLQALNNIIAVGDDQVLDNHYCGAESGYIPVSTVCPSVLIHNLELQSKDETLVTQYILPRPELN